MKKSFSRLHILVGVLLLLSLVFVGISVTKTNSSDSILANILGGVSRFWGTMFWQQPVSTPFSSQGSYKKLSGVCVSGRCVTRTASNSQNPDCDYWEAPDKTRIYDSCVETLFTTNGDCKDNKCVANLKSKGECSFTTKNPTGITGKHIYDSCAKPTKSLYTCETIDNKKQCVTTTDPSLPSCLPSLEDKACDNSKVATCRLKKSLHVGNPLLPGFGLNVCVFVTQPKGDIYTPCTNQQECANPESISTCTGDRNNAKCEITSSKTVPRCGVPEDCPFGENSSSYCKPDLNLPTLITCQYGPKIDLPSYRSDLPPYITQDGKETDWVGCLDQSSCAGLKLKLAPQPEPIRSGCLNGICAPEHYVPGGPDCTTTNKDPNALCEISNSTAWCFYSNNTDEVGKCVYAKKGLTLFGSYQTKCTPQKDEKTGAMVAVTCQRDIIKK